MGGVSLGSFKMPAVKGQPYSLVSKTTIIKVAADGTPVTTVREERKMRDAEGRERTEIVLPNGGVIVPHITDPVAQMTITLFPGSKTAYVTRIPLPPPPTPEQEAKATELRARVEEYRKAHPLSPDTDNELQPQTIAGVYATGRRHVLVVPAGSRAGSDQEIRIVEDKWISPDLKIEMASTTDDPRPAMGKITTVVTELNRVDPDAALFQIPTDYKVIEHKN
jgi:hypothetical protein